MMTRRGRLSDAKKRRTLMECPICANDEILVDEMVKCNNPLKKHFCCQECVKKHTKIQIGLGANTIRCMAVGCENGRFSLAGLETVIDRRLMQLLLERVQQEELRGSNLKNLHSCPFCNFLAVIDIKRERLFQCLNQDCRRESCLECQEPSHAPLKCSEVERDVETQRRVFIENRMAEAMKRHCPACRMPIMKTEGCNLMRCPCRSLFCYACGIRIKDGSPYDHFKSCRQQMTIDHKEAARKAGEEAKQKFTAENPERAKRFREEKDVDINKLL